MSASEQRRHPRFNVDLEAAVSSGDRQLAARTRDLSRSGICLVCPESVAPGTEIQIDLVLTFGENAASEPLTVSARVVWCTPLFGSFQVGGMFVALSPETTKFIEMFLHFLDGTLAPDALEGGPGSSGDDSEDDDPDREAIEKDNPFRS